MGEKFDFGGLFDHLVSTGMSPEDAIRATVRASKDESLRGIASRAEASKEMLDWVLEHPEGGGETADRLRNELAALFERPWDRLFPGQESA